MHFRLQMAAATWTTKRYCLLYLPQEDDDWKEQERTWVEKPLWHPGPLILRLPGFAPGALCIPPATIKGKEKVTIMNRLKKESLLRAKRKIGRRYHQGYAPGICSQIFPWIGHFYNYLIIRQEPITRSFHTNCTLEPTLSCIFFIFRAVISAGVLWFPPKMSLFLPTSA